MFLEELACRIRSQREKRGLRQQDIANALNLSPQAVSKWERGENAPDIALVGPLARLLGVSVDWLIGSPGPDKDVFEATVLTSSIDGAYQRSLDTKPREFAAWLNGIFYSLTETALRHGGVPVKCIGDGYLCFFSGSAHRDRALKTAIEARHIAGENLVAGLSTGEIFLGSVGHPDYARPDIMGEVVNVAFLAMQWVQPRPLRIRVAAAAPVLEGVGVCVQAGACEDVNFRGISVKQRICEIHSVD